MIDGGFKSACAALVFAVAMQVSGARVSLAAAGGMSLLGEVADTTQVPAEAGSGGEAGPGALAFGGGSGDGVKATLSPLQRVYDYFAEAVKLTGFMVGAPPGTDGVMREKFRDRIVALRQLILTEFRQHSNEVVDGLATNGDLGQVLRMLMFGVVEFSDVDASLRALVRELKGKDPKLLGKLVHGFGLAVAQEAAMRGDSSLSLAIIGDLVSMVRGPGNTAAWILKALESPLLTTAQGAFIDALQIPTKEWEALDRGLVAQAKAIRNLHQYKQGHAQASLVLARQRNKPGSGVDAWGATYPHPSH